MRVLFNIERLINPSPAEKEGLHKILHIRTLKKNEFFLKEGEVCTTLAFIENGSIRYFYQLEEKQVCKDFIFENGWSVPSPASSRTTRPGYVLKRWKTHRS